MSITPNLLVFFFSSSPPILFLPLDFTVWPLKIQKIVPEICPSRMHVCRAVPYLVFETEGLSKSGKNPPLGSLKKIGTRGGGTLSPFPFFL